MGLTNTKVSTFKEAGAALRASPVHRPHSSSVRRLVADPVHVTHTHTHTEFEFKTFKTHCQQTVQRSQC